MSKRKILKISEVATVNDALAQNPYLRVFTIRTNGATHVQTQADVTIRLSPVLDGEYSFEISFLRVRGLKIDSRAMEPGARLSLEVRYVGESHLEGIQWELRDFEDSGVSLFAERARFKFA